MMTPTRVVSAALACALALACVSGSAAAQLGASEVDQLEEHEIERDGTTVRLMKYKGQLYRIIGANDLKLPSLPDASLHGLSVCVEGKFAKKLVGTALSAKAYTFQLIGSDRHFVVADRKVLAGIAGVMHGTNVWLGGQARRLPNDASCYMAVYHIIPLPRDTELFNKRFAQYSIDGKWQRLLDLANWIEVSGKQAEGVRLMDSGRYRTLRDKAVRKALNIRERTLAPDDAQGWCELARMYSDLLPGVGKLAAVERLRRAFKANAAHESTREFFDELGYVLHNGQWITEEERARILAEKARLLAETAEAKAEADSSVGTDDGGEPAREGPDLRERLARIREVERQVRNDPQGLSAVVERLKEENEAVARRIVWILANTGGDGHEGLLEGMDSPSAAVRRDVADAFAWGGKLTDLKTLIRSDGDGGVRSHGVDALASLGTRESMGALVSLASLEDEGTRSYVVATLQKLTEQKLSDADAWKAWWKGNRQSFPPSTEMP
jgi:hypothetical protein